MTKNSINLIALQLAAILALTGVAGGALFYIADYATRGVIA